MIEKKRLPWAAVILVFAALVVAPLTGARPADVQLTVIPPGAVLAYVGPLTGNLGQNWVLCDGRQVNSPGSIFHNAKVPDLTDNRFLMGVSAATPVGAGTAGGSNALASDGEHTHSVAFNGYAAGEINYARGSGRNDPFQMQYRTAGAGAHTHGGDKRPAHLPVHFICKIR